MSPRARSLSLASLLALAACTRESNDDTGGFATLAGMTASASSTAAEPTGATTTPDTTTIADQCPDRPAGAYNACEVDGFTDNKLCGWTTDGGPQSLTCLSPQSGGYNVCGLRDCVDDCDCFTPPTTGTALPGCRAIFGDGGKACVLYCLNGQVCPDGMACANQFCYWPN